VNKTHHLDLSGKITVFRENTNSANGIALTKDGELLFAEKDRISKRARDGAITTIADNHAGQPMLNPTI
jgi:sugar lactone lactonase YvrE